VACLQALLDQQTDVDFEIIVVDVEGIGANHLSKKIDDSRINWIQTEARNPYTSRNIGLDKASGDTLVLIDAKCRASQGFITETHNAATQSPKTLLAGHYNLEVLSDDIKEKVYGALYLNTKKNVDKGYGVTAGNLAFSKALYDDAGQFDDSHHSGMDILWSKKVMSLGYKVRYVPNMSVNYPSQTWHELKESLKKYFCGISYIHTTEELGFGSRLGYLLRHLVPMKVSTFNTSLENRALVSSPKDKVYLWLRVWQAKLYMAKAYLRCWIKHED